MVIRTSKAHPWHGIDIGDDAPTIVTAFIEIVPGDTVKYEIDKESGFLKIDRPQQYSNVVPANYGFIPRTYCSENIAKLAGVSKGDNDPLDILVLCEHHIPRGDILVKARPIGGICLIDHGEADDKIIAVLNADRVYGRFRDISELPDGVVERIEHYFLTYKSLPDSPNVCEISAKYGREQSHKVVNAAIDDYRLLVGS